MKRKIINIVTIAFAFALFVITCTLTIDCVRERNTDGILLGILALVWLCAYFVKSYSAREDSDSVKNLLEYYAWSEEQCEARKKEYLEIYEENKRLSAELRRLDPDNDVLKSHKESKKEDQK